MLITQPLGTRRYTKKVDINAIALLEILGFGRLGDPRSRSCEWQS